MPISVSAQVKPLTDAEFEELDYRVMGLAFQIHKEQGRLCDEKIYQNILAWRCTRSGIGSVVREVPIRVTYGSFSKIYYIDILINRGAVIELKAVSAFTNEHENQLINYLLLTGLRHGKLINLRAESVQGKRVVTGLTQEKRRQLNFIHVGGLPNRGSNRWFRETMIALLQHWGGFLSIQLYQEALEYFIARRRRVDKAIEFIVAGVHMGRQKVSLLDNQTAFAITTLKGKVKHYEEHLKRIIRHTRLEAIEWVNMVHHDIAFRTVQ